MSNIRNKPTYGHRRRDRKSMGRRLHTHDVLKLRFEAKRDNKIYAHRNRISGAKLFRTEMQLRRNYDRLRHYMIMGVST